MGLAVLLLLIAALACFLVDAFGATLGRVNPGWLGLALEAEAR